MLRQSKSSTDFYIQSVFCEQWQVEATINLITAGRGSFSGFLGDVQRRRRLFHNAINWDRVILAFIGNRAVGFATYKMDGRGPFSVNFSAFKQEYGRIGGSWRFALFVLTERHSYTHHSDCYLYGLKVMQHARRKGIASALMAAVIIKAQAAGKTLLQLDVNANNTKAINLYKKQGFIETNSLNLKPFRRFFSFATLLAMRLDLSTTNRD